MSVETGGMEICSRSDVKAALVLVSCLLGELPNAPFNRMAIGHGSELIWIQGVIVECDDALCGTASAYLTNLERGSLLQTMASTIDPTRLDQRRI